MPEGFSQSNTSYLFHSQPVIIPAHSRLHSRGPGNILTLPACTTRARCLHRQDQTRKNKLFKKRKEKKKSSERVKGYNTVILIHQNSDASDNK